MLDTNLATLRKVRSLTQSDLARLLNLDVSTISRWERGECGPPTTGDSLRNLAAALGCQVWQLFHPDPLAAGKAERLRLGIGPEEPVALNTEIPENRWSRIARERAARGISQAEASEERYCS